MNYFELFDLPISPTVDKKLLFTKYLELQKKSHPDFFTDATEDEQEEALQQSAHINKAYKIFQNPDSTIEYFLMQTGSLKADEKFSLPNEFLMEMMDINEMVVEDLAAARQAVEALSLNLTAIEIQIAERYAQGNRSKENLENLKLVYYKKKYLQRILDRLTD